MSQSSHERRFDMGAWLHLILMSALLVLSIANLVYRYTLPTDGWSVYTTDIDPANWVYWVNLVGAPSGLMVGDELLAVDGRSVAGAATAAYVEAPPGWQAGGGVTMTVIRDGERRDVKAPVANWTPAAFWRYNAGTPDKAFGLLGALIFVALGWFTFWRRPATPSARALLVLSAIVGATTISGMLPDGLSVQFDRMAFSLTLFFSYVIFGILYAPTLLAFSLLFPHPKRVIQRHPKLALIPVLLGLLVFIAVIPLHIAVLGWLGTLAMVLASIISFIHSAFTQRDAVSRAQLRWAIGGLVLGLALFLLNFPMAFGLITDPFLIALFNILPRFGLAVIGVGLAVAILRYRLYDIDVIIRKTVQYGVVTALLALVYFGLVVLLQTLFGRATGEQSPVIIVISTLAIAALFTPLRRRVQDGIDRRFFRKKYDAQQVLADFARTARDETDLDALLAELERVVGETMQPEGVSVWLVDTAPNQGRR